MTVPLENPPDRDTGRLACVLAWEDIFGPRPLSWQDLAALGCGLNRDEGQRYLENQLTEEGRSGLYQALFEAHPLLQTDIEENGPSRLEAALGAQRRRVQEKFPSSQFIARLSPTGGPPPDDEVAELVEHGRSAAAWIPTRAMAKKWRHAPWPAENVGLFVYESGGTFQGMLGSIHGRQDSMPMSPVLQRLYGKSGDYSTWWEVAEPVAVQFASLDQIPGRSTKDLPARRALAGNSRSFFFWNFGLALAELVAQFRKR